MTRDLHITLRHLFIANKQCIGLEYAEHKVLTPIVKQLQDIKWSDQLGIHYLPNTKKHYDLLFQTFKGVAWLNCRYLDKNKPINTSRNEQVDLDWYTQRKVTSDWIKCPSAYYR